MVTFLAVIAAIAIAAGVAVWLVKKRQSEFEAIVARRKATAKISSKAELVDGRNHIPVALTLDPQQIYYENTDLEAALDIARIDEVEYASDLVTGAEAKGRVLRLRSNGRAFEFVMDPSAAEQWSRHLPPHRLGEERREATA